MIFPPLPEFEKYRQIVCRSEPLVIAPLSASVSKTNDTTHPCRPQSVSPLHSDHIIRTFSLLDPGLFLIFAHLFNLPARKKPFLTQIEKKI